MANIIDIRSIDVADIDTNETFAIDTNALVWTHYSKASDSRLNKHPYQVVEYPNFINKLLQNGNMIVTTILNITELCGVVERNEYKIYKAVNHLNPFSIKDYRKLAAARSAYKKEIDTMIMEIESVYDNHVEEVALNEQVIDRYKKDICSNHCDIFDYAVIEYLKQKGIKNYISDDKDFASVDEINLFTTSEASS
ncbi:MAG: hypothetical protein IJ801_03510 [Lachnospiraceae bacterium]|nr:hypothetical protein [Lachnospiraceae bacterium]